MRDGSQRLRLRGASWRSKAPSQPPAIWQFVNSSLGLWLLSAIFISGAGTLYARYTEGATAERERVERVGKIDIEIEYRYSQMLERLFATRAASYAGINKDRVDPAVLQEERRQAGAVLGSVASVKDQSLYLEFKDYSLMALEAELQRLLSGKQADEVRTSLLTLVSIRGTQRPLAREAAEKLYEAILARWQKVQFPYMVCTQPNPFCDEDPDGGLPNAPA